MAVVVFLKVGNLNLNFGPSRLECVITSVVSKNKTLKRFTQHVQHVVKLIGAVAGATNAATC